MIVQDNQQLVQALSIFKDSGMLAVDVETSRIKKKNNQHWELDLYGIGIHDGKNGVYIPNHQDVYEIDIQKIQELFKDREIVMHNAKFDLSVLEGYGFDFNSCEIHDIRLMSYLIDENRSNRLKDLARNILKIADVTHYDDVAYNFDDSQKSLFESTEVPEKIEKMGKYCIKDVEYTIRLYFLFKEELEKQSIWKLYDKLERKLLLIMKQMTVRGIRVNVKYLEKMDKKLDISMAELESLICKNFEEEVGKINLGSSEQVAKVFFEKYKLSMGERSEKTGKWLLGEDKLIEIKNYYYNITHNNKIIPAKEKVYKVCSENAELMLKFRKYKKLKTTYTSGLLKQVFDGVIHASFNETSTVTGRWSCLAGNTILNTNNGKIKIKNLLDFCNLGQYTIFDEQNKESKIVKVIFKGYDKLYKLTCDNGSIIYGTKTHRVQTSQGDWRELGKCKKGCKLCGYSNSIKDSCIYMQEGVQEILDYEQKNFQRADFEEILHSKSVKKVFKYLEQCGCGYEAFLPEGILKGVKRFERESLCKNKSRKLARQKGHSESITRQREIEKVSRSGNGNVGDSYINENNSLDGAGECDLLWAKEYKSSTAREIQGNGFKYSSKIRAIQPRFSKGFRNFLFRPSEIFYKNAQGDDRVDETCLLYKKNEQKPFLFFGEEKNKSFSYMLELKQSGVIIIRCFIKGGYSSSEASIHTEGEKVYSRFFNRGFSCRSRRSSAHERVKDDKKGQSKEYTDKKEQMEDVKSIRFGGGKKSEKNSAKNKEITIEEIKEIGVGKVWDISVGGGHSYQANGLIHHNSSNPNLQNLPTDTEYDIRKAFIARKGYKFIISDYSQIELRILAHYSKDENMIKVYKNNGDIHRKTADELKCDRKSAKTCNFAVSYGTSSYTLMDQINKQKKLGEILITKGGAQEFIDRYFGAYPKVKKLLDRTKVLAKKQGFVRSFTNRKRRLQKWIYSQDKGIQAHAERQAANFLIQAGAADILKIAIRNINEKIQDKFDAHLLVQVHDELIYECLEPQVNEVQKIIKEEMEKAGESLRVPLITEPEVTRYWKK